MIVSYKMNCACTLISFSPIDICLLVFKSWGTSDLIFASQFNILIDVLGVVAIHAALL